MAFSAVTAAADSSPLTGSEAADTLRAYWAPDLKAKIVDLVAEATFLRHTPESQLGTYKGPPEAFAHDFLGKRDSAPGPDGLRHAVRASPCGPCPSYL